MRILVLSSVLCLAACQAPLNLSLPDRAERPGGTPVPSTPPVVGESLGAVGYNVESGDAEVGTIAAKITEVEGEHLWGFSEALDQSWLDAFATAADDGSQDFQTVLGSTGNQDRLGIVFDDTALELIGTQELSDINVGGSARAPLVAEFEVRSSGARFLFMVNHLWRTEADSRLQQAQMLNTWVANESLPVVAVGDYNFDWAVDDGENDHDAAYDAMVVGDNWVWVRPEELIPTQCSFSGQAVLDFAFVGNGARSWPATSEILFPQNVNCVDDEFKPDHRPVRIDFTVPDPPG